MKHNNYLNQEEISALVEAFKLVIGKGTVVFRKEAVFVAMIDQCLEDGLFDEAIMISENALTQYPFSVDILVRLAKTALKLKHFDKCDVTIERVFALSPQSIYAVLLKAECLAAKNKRAEALTYLQPAKTSKLYSDEERADIFQLEALILDVDGRYQDMYRSLKKCLLLNPNNKSAYKLIYLAIEHTGMYNAGIAFYNKLISKNAYNAGAWLNLGHAHTALCEDEDALEAFGFSFAIDEKCFDAYMESGDILLRHNKFKEAQSLFDRALLHCGGSPEVYQKLGICSMHQRRFKRAHEYLIKSLELEPNDAETHFYLGKCAIAAGQWSLAVRALESAVALEDSLEEYFATLGEAYMKVESFLDAMKCFRRATIIAPENIEMWIKHVRFLIEVGQIQTALKIIDEAELNTGTDELEIFRIGCLFTIGRHKEGMELLINDIEKNSEKSHLFFEYFPKLEQNSVLMAIFEAYSVQK